MKQIFNFPFAIIFTAFLILTFSSCGGPAGSAKPTDSTTIIPPPAVAVTEPPKENWSYSQDSDKMTSKIKYFATVDANEPLQLKAPYDGGVTATVTIRNMKGENEAMLQISKGQFLAGVDGVDIQVRFDTLKAETYSCSGPSDYSSTVLFIQSSAKFIAHLKKAKKLLIGAEMYDNGVQQMEFNVAGFKWNR